MDESKDKDVNVGSVTESGATVTALEACETLVEPEPMVCEEGQVEEGGSLHGEDIMVEVLGSDVFVDGVCTSSGDGIAENADLGEDVGHGVGELDEVVQEKEVKSFEGVNQEVGSSALDSMKTEGVGLCGQRGVSEQVVAKEREEGTERGVEDSSAEECTGGEARIVVTKEATEVRVDEYSDISKKDAVFGDEVRNPVVENGVESSLAVEGSYGGETQVVVVDKVSSTVVESVSYTTVAANNGLEKQRVGISNDLVVKNTEIETTVVCSSTVVESVIVHTQGFQEAPEIVEKGLNPEVAVCNAKPESFDTQTQPPVEEEVAGEDNKNSACAEAEEMDTDTGEEGSVDKQLANVKVGGEIIEDHNNALPDPVPSCQPTEVIEDEHPKVLSSSGKDQQLKLDESLDEGVARDPGQLKSCIAEEMEVDTQFTDAKQIDERGGHEVDAEQLELKAETVCTVYEIETKVSDKMEGEIASNSNEETINSKGDNLVPMEKDQELKSEECAAYDFAQLDSDVVKVVEVKEQANVAQEVKEQPNNEGNGSDVDDSVDPESLCQLAHLIVEGDVAAMDIDILPNLEIQGSVGLDGTIPCSENDQNLKPETVRESKQIDNLVSDKGEMATASNEVVNDNIECQGPEGEKDQQSKRECFNSSANHDLFEVDSNTVKEVVAENHVTDAEHVLLQKEQEADFEEQEADFEEQVADNEDPKSAEQKSSKEAAQEPEISAQEAGYQLPAEIEDEFAVSDLVWGKVRSHPWWPGQIFDPSDSSEKAMKHHKKDCFLVAYFGDRTFAWNEASLLKPFRTHFAQIEKQSNSEAFQNAVDYALEEVSRRVELGLACSCIPNDAYDSIKFQMVENTGIREESSMRAGVDKSASASSFEPDKLIEYIKALAQSPSVGADRLELVVAKAQLLALCRYKGYSQLPELQFGVALLESGTEMLCPEGQEQLDGVVGYSNPVCENADQMISESQESASHKRKHNLRDMYPIKKERSLFELMDGTLDFPEVESVFDGKTTSKLVSPTSAKKRKTFESTVDDTVIQDGTKGISLSKVSNTSTSPKQSFKIGECIQRAATHLTGSPSIMKHNNDKPYGDGFGVSLEELEESQGESMFLSAECSSLDELLSQLHLAAQDPFQSYRFLNIIVGFFSDFRDSVVPSQSSVMEKSGDKRKMSSHSIAGFPETFEFVDMNDSYWTDMVVQNGSLEQLSRKSKREYQIVPVALEPDKSVQASRRPYSRKRYRDANSEIAAAETKAYMDEKKRASPAEIIMTFPKVNSVPSETNLSKMFRRFGPLQESETEVERETCRARVVYKKGSDAEVAYSSAGKFKIFGSVVVNYQLNFSPFEPFKALYTPSIEGLEEATLYLHSQS